MSAATTKTGRFERSEDCQTWEPVNPKIARGRLSTTYRDVDAVVKMMMEDGEIVRTAFAFYRFVPTPA